MPYLKPEDKEHLERESVVSNTIKEIGQNCKSAGELNYTITRVIQGYMRSNKKCYQTMNDIIGALEGAKAEFYRRTIAPYENLKIESNGDVSE